MARVFIDVRDKAQENKVVKTYVFHGDTSVIVTALKRIMIIEHEVRGGHTIYIDLGETEVISVRNWG